MRYSELLETEDTDRAQRNAARSILAKITKGIRAHTFHTANITSMDQRGKSVNIACAYLTMDEIGVKSFSDLAIGYIDEDAIRASAALLNIKKLPTPHTLPPHIEYFLVVPTRMYKEVEIVGRSAESLVNRIKSGAPLFLHELVHYLDERRGVPITRGKPHSSEAEYYNDPVETNAYYQMAVSLFDKKPNAFFNKPFTQWVKIALKMFEKDFLKKMNDTSRKHLLKRLYRLWASKNKKEMGLTETVKTTPKTVKLRAGTTLYHGTQTPETFVIPKGPAFFAETPEIASQWVDWKGSRPRTGHERILSFETTTDLALFSADTLDEWQALGEQFVRDQDPVVGQLTHAMRNKNQNGWRNDSEVMLCFPAEVLRPLGSLTEAVETIDGIDGTTVRILRDPTRTQMINAISGWHNSCRGILNYKTDTVYLFDAWSAYHYQVCMKLGLENAIGFIAQQDGIGLYEEENISDHFANQYRRLRRSPRMKRIWGLNFKISVVDPD